MHPRGYPCSAAPLALCLVLLLASAAVLPAAGGADAEPLAAFLGALGLADDEPKFAGVSLHSSVSPSCWPSAALRVLLHLSSSAALSRNITAKSRGGWG